MSYLEGTRILDNPAKAKSVSDLVQRLRQWGSGNALGDIAADHLSICSERMLAALNRKHAAVERCEVADMGDIGAPARAQAELEAAEADVSEYWRAIQSAAYEYRKRAKRFRAALSAADAKGEKG